MKRSSYRLVPAEKRGVSSEVKLPAQLAAYQEVGIFPKVNAYVKSISVDIGDRVHQGQLLMTLEAPELLQATIQAKEKYARAKADYSIDRERYQRLMEAAQTPGAISALDLSSIRSKMAADSALSNAEKSNWQMQNELQGYLTVTAPFSGVITQRNAYPGALVNSVAKDKPILELKDNSRLRLQVEVPEALAGTLRIKDTISFFTSAAPGKRMTGKISRKAMNVNPQFRSEKVEIDVDNRDFSLSSGMYADLIVYSGGHASAMVVPTAAVITTTERKFVWLVVGGKAIKADVTSGDDANGKTEVFGNILEGQEVIANPDDELVEGIAVADQ